MHVFVVVVVVVAVYAIRHVIVFHATVAKIPLFDGDVPGISNLQNIFTI